MEAGILGGVGSAQGSIDRAPDAGRNPLSEREEGVSRSHAGFTLLELLVVLALVGLVTALAVPNLERLYRAVTREAERDHILDQFAGLGRRAMHQSRNYVVFGAANAGDPAVAEPLRESAGTDGEGAVRSSGGPVRAGYEPYEIDLPEGWEIRLDPPLVIRANGVCLGATLTLHYEGEAESQIELEPPWCRVGPDA